MSQKRLAKWKAFSSRTVFLVLELLGQRGIGGLMENYVEVYDTTVTLGSWAITTLVGLTFLMAPVTKIVSDLTSRRGATVVCGVIYSCCFILLGAFGTSIWQVFVLHIIAGTSASLVNIASYMTLGDHFGANFGIAHSAAMFVAAVSGIVSPLMMAHFEDTYGFRWALILFGAVAAHFVVAGVCMVPTTHDDEDMVETVDRVDDSSLSMLRAHPHVILHLVFYAITWILSASFAVVLDPFGRFCGLSSSSATLLIVWYSIGSLCGRCFVFIVFQRGLQNRVGVVLFPVSLAIVAQTVAISTCSEPLLIGCAVLVGVSTGSMNNWGSSMVRDISCDVHFGSTAAWVTTSAGIGATIAGLLIGWVYGVRRSYGDVMLFLASLNVVQCILSSIVLTWKQGDPQTCGDAVTLRFDDLEQDPPKETYQLAADNIRSIESEGKRS